VLFVILLFLLLATPLEAKLVPDVPEKFPPSAATKTEAKVLLKGYPDVPADHWAREAIDELVEAGVIDPGIGRPFWGEDPVDRFRLMYFLSQLLEKLLMGEKGELPLADFSLGYKDVNPINPAYRAIQKLIALGLLPPGFRQEVFRGETLVTRYQLVYFLFVPIEQLLSPTITFEEAPAEQGYRDVPSDNFAYPTIQKLINLGVLTGEGNFEGDKPATRYLMAYLSVKILKQIYLKVKEKEEAIALAPPPLFGFKTLLSTNLSFSFVHAGKGTEDLLNLYGQEGITIAVDRTLSSNLSAYLSLANSFFFGSSFSPTSLNLGEAYFNYAQDPFTLQLGRGSNYFSYSPFGASLLLDNRIDALTFIFSPRLGKLLGSLGKLTYQSDVTADSNFALSLLTFNPLPFCEISLGGSFVNDPPDPTGSTQLSTQMKQTYGGIKINFSNFELAWETSQVDFSNPKVLPQVGTTDEVELSAFQTSLSYQSPEFGYCLSLGFQHLGDDFYNAGLAFPGSATYSGPGKDAYLIKNRMLLSENESLTAGLNLIYQKGINLENYFYLTYARQFHSYAYLNLNFWGAWDPMDLSKLNSLQASSSVSLSF